MSSLRSRSGGTLIGSRRQTVRRADEQPHAELRLELRDELRPAGYPTFIRRAQVENEPVSITMMKVSNRGESVHSRMAQDRRS